MNIIYVGENKNESWDKCVLEGNGSFLQSWEWGEFQKSLGRKMWRLAVTKTDGSFGLCVLAVKYELPSGKNYLYCPRIDITQNSKEIFNELKSIASREKSLFLKIDPELDRDKLKETKIEVLGFAKSFKEIQPRNTLILNITKTEEELFAEMKSKTRYNIKLAKRKELVVEKCENDSEKKKCFDSFWPLMQETADRNKFYLHSKDYYNKQLDWSSFKMFLIKYNEKIIAGAIINFFGKRATYVHGASGHEYRNLMAPYLLHWEIIRQAKNLGCEEYDFWGISDSDSGKDSWAGISRFKGGFGGREINYIGAYDYILNRQWYGMYKLLTQFRRFLLKLKS